jgi:hypothetical protein
MIDKVQDLFRSQSRMTDPGSYADLYNNLPSSVPGLVRLVQGLIIDKDLVSFFGLSVDDAQRLGEVDTRYLSDILELLLRKDPRPLADAREPRKRFIGSCRDYALLLCSLLRHQGVPARLRFGFATYFSKESNVYDDHCVCEYWNADESRWILVDPNVDPVITKKLNITANILDLKRDEFVVAADAWKLAREGKVDADRFGVLSINIHGLWFIRGSLMRDLAARNKVEMLPWDYWGLADKAVVEEMPDAELPVLDELAAALSGNDLSALASLYKKAEFVVPDRIRSYTPLKGPVEVDLHAGHLI